MLSKNCVGKQKNNQSFSNFNGDVNSLNKPRARQSHELYTEMLSMREKSEMKPALSAQMCRLETPSRSVESEPENVLNTASPGRCSSWVLPHEMMTTPDRPTTSGLHPSSGVCPCSLAQVLRLKSIVVEVHVEYSMLEKPEKRNVNSFEIHPQKKVIQTKKRLT